MEAAAGVFFKSLFLAWLWLELSRTLEHQFKLPTLPRRLLHQGTLDTLVFYLISLHFLSGSSIENYLHICFLPYLIMDLFLVRRGHRLQVYFWMELLCIVALIYSGLKISFVTDPRGGFFLLEQGSYLVTFFWMVFLVSLLNLFNVVEGLLYVVSTVLAASFIIGILVQPWVASGSLEFSFVGLAFCMMIWIFTALRESSSLNALSFQSSLALLLGCLSVISTTKRMAIITLSSTLGLFLIPIVFFAFVIYFTHFHYKFVKYKEFAKQPQFLWRFTTGSVNAFIFLACVCEISILMAFFFFENVLWSFGILCFALVMFARFSRRIFIKSKVRYQDIFFPHEDHIEMFETRIFRGTKSRALEIVDKTLQKDEFEHLVTPDALCLFRTVSDRKFASILRRSFMAIPDGAGVLWASIFLKERPILERIPGIEFTRDLCELCECKGYGVYFLGAKQEVLEQAVSQLKSEYPQLEISGIRNGYFKEEEEDQIIDQINQSGAKILFVALGVPLQEYFIQRSRHKFKIPMAMGIGGSLDVISGNLKRSPKFFQDYGLEWLYRTVKEPWRISRIIALPLYILAVLKQKLHLGDREIEKQLR